MVSQWARLASAASVGLLTWIGPLSSTRTTGGGRRALWAVESVENLQMCDEVGAALGARGRDDELSQTVLIFEPSHAIHIFDTTLVFDFLNSANANQFIADGLLNFNTFFQLSEGGSTPNSIVERRYRTSATRTTSPA
jgi:hypothetical protein